MARDIAERQSHLAKMLPLSHLDSIPILFLAPRISKQLTLNFLLSASSATLSQPIILKQLWRFDDRTPHWLAPRN
jgi:hypothetical protein